MANELKLAKAAREIARELQAWKAPEAPEAPYYPFEAGHVFRTTTGAKTPCCVVGQVIHRAGFTDLAKGRPMANGGISHRSSTAALEDVCGVAALAKPVEEVVGDLVESNDYSPNCNVVAHRLYALADVLELAAAPTNNETPEA